MSVPYDLRFVDGLPVIQTERLILMIAMTDQVGQIVRYLSRNKEHLRPWEPARSDGYFTEAAWFGAPDRDQREAREGDAYRFRLFAKPDFAAQIDPSLRGEYLGTVSLREIAPWPMHNATIGYSLEHAVEGRGLMSEAVAAVIRFGFEYVNLRRIEACYMPGNERSAKLLTNLGFETEGLLRSSLEVNGRWEDHQICALINQNWHRR